VILKTFGWSFAVTAVGLGLAFWYGGTNALIIAAILGVLEISLSFDNAVINATVLGRMNPFWQKIFLTIGVLIAVFGMRLVFPLLIVGITAKLSPVQAVSLAINDGERYGQLLGAAHPMIAAFGGMFLLMLFLDFVFEKNEISWLTWIEKPLARIGELNQASVIVALVVLVVGAETLAAPDDVRSVLVAGIVGLVSYIAVNALSELFEVEDEESESSAGKTVVQQAGKAAFFLFLYLEVLDASFSFDGVIGAFAITSDPVVIMLGLGIGAMYIRSLTVFLVRKGTLNDYVYLEHGAHWAIGALAILLILSLRYEIPEVVTGLIGVALIGAALLSSLVRNKKAATEQDEEPVTVEA
jgi:uncharacterized protein